MKTYSITQIFEAIRDHLKSHADRLECFGKYEFQSEGWLKAEWMTVLEGLRRDGKILKADREVTAKGKMKVDISVNLNDGQHWIELKHWYIGKQKGQRWRVIDFIEELVNECEKLTAVNAQSRAWIAILCTFNPGENDWISAIKHFNEVNKPWCLSCRDNPSDYPSSYFFGVLNVSGLDA